ncbi:aspartic peptidase domain-containing protein [Mycena floridula]|nr:aspartic peptidase domain-containing protein [Mycena floridula]
MTPLFLAALCLFLLQSYALDLPIYRNREPLLDRRNGQVTETALRDYFDVTYNVLLQIGSVVVPLVLDTGSSDLWVVSDNCKTCTTDGLPVYSVSGFKPTGLDVTLLYGDSQTGTHAYGPIGTDSVHLGDLNLSDQSFAAIDDTNTSVSDTGSAGIFGLGFPINSFIWSEIFKANVSNSASTITTKRSFNKARRKFPAISTLFPSKMTRDAAGDFTNTILASYASQGPFLPRLIEDKAILPMFTVSLQRDTIDIGGNVGMLSIGEFPSQNSSMTWVPLRAYSESEGGLSSPSGRTETYPITWEIFIDQVYFDGQILPRSTLSSSKITLSALVDTGNSLIRGPQDVVAEIYKRLGGQVFSCSQAHNLSFSIGGNMFDVDPRDFITQAYYNNVDSCLANLAPTDAPVEGEGYLYSWSLGDPFLKSVISSFYFGNLSYPSVDPPKMGFLSTVPEDAPQKYTTAVQAAIAAGGNFPATTEAASGSPASATAKPTSNPNNATIHFAAPWSLLWGLVLAIILFLVKA